MTSLLYIATPSSFSCCLYIVNCRYIMLSFDLNGSCRFKFPVLIVSNQNAIPRGCRGAAVSYSCTGPPDFLVLGLFACKALHDFALLFESCALSFNWWKRESCHVMFGNSSLRKDFHTVLHSLIIHPMRKNLGTTSWCVPGRSTSTSKVHLTAFGSS